MKGPVPVAGNGAFFSRPTHVGQTREFVGRDSRRRNQRLAPTTDTTASDNPLCSTTAVSGWFVIAAGRAPPISGPNVAFYIFSGAFCILR